MFYPLSFLPDYVDKMLNPKMPPHIRTCIAVILIFPTWITLGLLLTILWPITLLHFYLNHLNPNK
jgi:hypothetical protein